MNQCIKIEKDSKGSSQLVVFGEFLWAKSGRNPRDHEFSVRAKGFLMEILQRVQIGRVH